MLVVNWWQLSVEFGLRDQIKSRANESFSFVRVLFSCFCVWKNVLFIFSVTDAGSFFAKIESSLTFHTLFFRTQNKKIVDRTIAQTQQVNTTIKFFLIFSFVKFEEEKKRIYEIFSELRIRFSYKNTTQWMNEKNQRKIPKVKKFLQFLLMSKES